MLDSQLLISTIERSSLSIVILLIVVKIPVIKKILQKEELKKSDIVIVAGIFSALSIISTYIGVRVEEALVDPHIAVIMTGGIIFGPGVGMAAGIVSGVGRFLMDSNNMISIAGLMSSIIAGFISTILYSYVDSKKKLIYGIAGGMLSVSIEMYLFYLLDYPSVESLAVIDQIYFPSLLMQLSIGIMVNIVQGIRDEEEKIAAMQSQIALNIANKTLPYFRNIDNKSLVKICNIIMEDINADAVAITDNNKVLAYVGIGEELYLNGDNRLHLSQPSIDSMEKNKIINIINDKTDHVLSKEFGLRSAMIIPLRENKEPIGVLKLYYLKSYRMTNTRRALAVGLSQIISTLMEVSKIEKIKQEANKAEIKALQTQINPHFLFNALNTITSFIRINPDKARELIINLSTYIRYNLEVSDKLIDIEKEIDQVKSYIEIEKARFNDKLNVIYDIDEDVNCKIPSLIIQPLVENSIGHGILKRPGKGNVKISVKKVGDNTMVSIEDDGVGISEEIIDRVKKGTMPEGKIGLYNVHLRLKLLYGKGLDIKVLEQGTLITFMVYKIN